MTKEIYISSTPHETRLAVVEDDQLAEIYYERENEYTLAGSVYKGKVTRVLPGMQSAFVDIGLERDAFLYVTDFAEEQEDGDEYVPLTQNQPHGNGHQASAGNNAPRREPSGNAPRESAGNSPAAEGGETSQSGGRRWRGRRGRRRGRSGAPQQNQPTSAPLETTAESNSFSYGDEEIGSATADQEATEESVAPEHFTPLPKQSEHSHSSETMVLPGETLSKYRRGQPSEQLGNRSSAPSPRPIAPASTFRPSTMVTGPLAWDGSDVLPGESISRHKNRSPVHPSVPETQGSEALSGSHAEVPATFASPAAEAGAEAEMDVPQVGPMANQRANADEPPVETSPEPARFEPERASASYRFDPSAPSAYRQSSVVEPPVEGPAIEESTSEELVHDDPTDRFVSETQVEALEKPEPFLNESVSIVEPRVVAEHHSTEREIAGEDDRTDDLVDERGMHVFDPGHGTLEEETLDDEESENDAAEALLEDEEYDDLIEETLDMQMDSGLIGELVRDQHIDERTHFQDDSTEAAGAEEHGPQAEPAFDERMTDVELEEMEELEGAGAEETEEGARVNADTAARTERFRGNRRGFRGRGGDRHRMRRSSAQTSNLPVITELLKPNQEILVQIAKEPIARKGARITSHIALPGRFLVFMPTINHVGVSRKISSDEQRQRLKHILLSEKGPAPGGFIVRTAAASASEEDLRADIRFLLTLWSEIKQRADGSKPPALIYHDLSLVERVLRDQVTDNFSSIWVDSEADYERVLRFLNRFEPGLVRRVKLYTKETPLFEQFGIQEEINKALRSKVWLKSGGSIVINQTEALVAIDINTGKYVGKTARLEDTILKTNLDAIPEIVRQIRLRDLGGIIVIDFIDMDERKNRNKVMVALEEALKSDRAPSKVLQFNDFGLVAITRKRVKQSLERTLSVPCSVCTGTGMVKGPITVCNEIYVELRKMHKQIDRGDIMLRVNPEVVKQLKSANGKWLSEMEEMSRKTIIVKSDATLHPEQFDIH